MQRVVIVDPSDTTREPLRNLLLGLETVWLEADCQRYEFFFDVIQQYNPDVAVVALDADHNKALQLISQLTAEAPHLAILAVSARGDGQSILQALRAGAKEFLTQPVAQEELLKALNRLGASRVSLDPERGRAPATPDSLVIALLGSRGGVGCTSLAVNLGCTLAQDKSASVALIDLDLALGDADVALDLMPDYTLADVALNIERLDMSFLKRTLCKHPTGLSLLPHPVQLEDIGLIHEDHIQRVIQLLRASYSHLLLDLSMRFTATDITALKMADIILVIAQLELTSLRNVVRLLLALNAEEGMGDKIRMILNRVGSDYVEGGDISVKKAEETIGRQIYWQIPNDARAMIGSRNAGVPLLSHAPKSKAQISIAGLAQALCGRGDQPPEVRKDKRSFFGFGGK